MSDFDKYNYLINELKNSYGLTLSKKQLALVLNISEVTLTRRIRESKNVPPYFKSGSGEKSSYAWNICDVAEFMLNTIKTH